MKSCCNSTKKTKKGMRKKYKKGFTMRSSSAPYKSSRRYKRTSKRFRKNKRTIKGGNNNTSGYSAVQRTLYENMYNNNELMKAYVNYYNAPTNQAGRMNAEANYEMIKGFLTKEERNNVILSRNNNTSGASAVQRASDVLDEKQRALDDIESFINRVSPKAQAQAAAKKYHNKEMMKAYINANYKSNTPTTTNLDHQRKTDANFGVNQGLLSEKERNNIILPHETWKMSMFLLYMKQNERKKAVEKAKEELEELKKAQKKQHEEKKKAEAKAANAVAAKIIATKYRKYTANKLSSQKRKAGQEWRAMVELIAKEFLNNMGDSDMSWKKTIPLNILDEAKTDCNNLISSPDDSNLISLKTSIHNMILEINKYVGCTRKRRNLLSSVKYTERRSLPCDIDQHTRAMSDASHICKKNLNGTVKYFNATDPCEFTEKLNDQLIYLEKILKYFIFADNLIYKSTEKKNEFMKNLGKEGIEPPEFV